MAIEGDVQAVLSALVAGRCYPMAAPEMVATPYIIFQVISNPTLNTLEGDAGISERRFQVDVWADTYGGAKALSKSVSTAMAAATFTNIKISDNDLYEPETKIYRVSMDFGVWGES